MHLYKKFATSLLSTSQLILPAPFLCSGCTQPCWQVTCESCFESVRLNKGLLESTTHSIEALAPLLFSYSQTHSLVKSWKSKQGFTLSQKLFQMDEQLRIELLSIGFDAIVPIPQSFNRSWHRGHESAVSVARFFSKKLQVPRFELLRLVENEPKRQALLSQFERETSNNPFDIAPDRATFFGLKKVLLIDDLITTGNTLARAAERMHETIPGLKVWGGSLAYRPKQIMRYREAKSLQLDLH